MERGSRLGQKLGEELWKRVKSNVAQGICSAEPEPEPEPFSLLVHFGGIETVMHKSSLNKRLRLQTRLGPWTEQYTILQDLASTSGFLLDSSRSK